MGTGCRECTEWEPPEIPAESQNVRGTQRNPVLWEQIPTSKPRPLELLRFNSWGGSCGAWLKVNGLWKLWLACHGYTLFMYYSTFKKSFSPPHHRHAFFFPKSNWLCPWANPTIPWFQTPCDFIEEPLYLVLLKHSLDPWFLKIQLQPLSIYEAIVGFHYILFVISWQSYEHIILFSFFPIWFLPSIFSSREYLDKREEQRQAREERFVSLFFPT